MPTSYLNHYLHIDLSNGKVTPFSLSEDVLRDYVGGKGVGAYLLATHQDPQAPAYAPENPLIFVMGPLTGTQAPSMRSGVFFQSPATRLFTDSYYGGFFGQELRAAGYDGLVITGKAPEWTLIEIDNDRVTPGEVRQHRLRRAPAGRSRRRRRGDGREEPQGHRLSGHAQDRAARP